MTERPAIGPATPLTALDAVSQVVREQARELKHHGKRVRKHKDAEAVHEMRVATRRLRTAIRALEGHVRAPKPLRERLKWLGGKLGAVRDDDVILELIGGERLSRASDDERTRLARLIEKLTERREKHRGDLVAALKRGRYRQLLDDLSDFVRAPQPVRGGDGAASRVLAEVSERLNEAVARSEGMRADAPRPESLHELRIAFKRLRYALDFHAAACGLAFDVERKLARRMQDVLGAIHDRDLLVEWLDQGKGAFRGPWPKLRERLETGRAVLYRRFLRLRREWNERTREEPAVAPLEAPRFVHLEPQPVTLRLVRGSRSVASSMIG